MTTKFDMIANSGVPFRHPFWGNFAVDLSGMRVPTKSLPVLMDHDVSSRVGFTERFRVNGDGLNVTGVLLSDSASDQARLIRQQSKEGFPWQASISVPPTEILRVEGGETATVNGHELKGPGHIFRSSDLREVSFVTLGADANTSAVLLSASTSANEVLESLCEKVGPKRYNTNQAAIKALAHQFSFSNDAVSFGSGNPAEVDIDQTWATMSDKQRRSVCDKEFMALSVKEEGVEYLHRRRVSPVFKSPPQAPRRGSVDLKKTWLRMSRKQRTACLNEEFMALSVKEEGVEFLNRMGVDNIAYHH